MGKDADKGRPGGKVGILQQVTKNFAGRFADESRRENMGAYSGISAGADHAGEDGDEGEVMGFVQLHLTAPKKGGEREEEGGQG